MSAERIDELLEKAAALDRHAEMSRQGLGRQGSDLFRDLDEIRADGMMAAGYRAEALVLQLQAEPRWRCDARHEHTSYRPRCRLEAGHEGSHETKLSGGSILRW